MMFGKEAQQVQLRAIDVGYGAVKAMSDEKRLEFPSVISQFKPVRFTTGMNAKEPLERLCVDYNGNKFFLGDIAFKQGTAQVNMSSSRFTEAEGLALLFAALAVLAEGNNETVNLITGLPVSDYADKKEAYQKALQGRHEVKLLSPDGKVLEVYRFTVNNVKILPQPAGTFFNRILDKNGNLTDRFLATSNVGILDIGHNTLDLARFDKLDFIDDESESFSDLGLFEAHKALSRELKSALGAEIRPTELEQYVRSGVIPFKGTLQSIIKERKKVYEEQAEKIVSRALNVWRDTWQLTRIFVTGGGASPMGSYMIKHFADPRQVEVCGNSTFTNVDGYLRYGKRIYRS